MAWSRPRGRCELAGPIHGALADISRTLTLPAAFEPATAKATIKIATIDLYHTKLLPSLVQYLRQQAPCVDLQVRANDCSHLHEQLAAGEIDIAFAPLGGKTAELRAEPLWNDRLVTLVGKDNPLREPMSIEAYAAAAHLVDAGHVQVSPDGVGTSVVDAIWPRADCAGASCWCCRTRPAFRSSSPPPI